MEQYIREAEAAPQQASPLSIPITLVQLQTAQRRLNTASCHGKDKIPNAALKTILLDWQVLFLALLNVMLHLAEFQLIWRHVLLAPFLKGGK